MRQGVWCFGVSLRYWYGTAMDDRMVLSITTGQSRTKQLVDGLPCVEAGLDPLHSNRRPFGAERRRTGGRQHRLDRQVRRADGVSSHGPKW